MDELIRKAPEIIEAAAKSPLGILALMILALAVAGFFFFRGASELTRIGIYVLMFVGVAAFGGAVIGVRTGISECSPERLKGDLLPVSGRSAGVIKAALTMRERFQYADFNCLENLATVLITFDQDNGHGLYFMGEAWRGRARQDPTRSDLFRERMRARFFRYLDVEARLPPSERDGLAATCYQREKGYCEERTAWINHIMANDFYDQAKNQADRCIKVQRLRRGLKFAKRALEFGGFDQMIPTKELIGKIEEELRAQGTQQC
jgi:hypothetical protein